VPNPNESELLATAKRGDVQAFEQVLRPHLPMLLAYCCALGADFHAAEDAVQETALVAFRKLEHLFPEVDFATWLRAIAKRQALAAKRQATKLPPAAEQALEIAYAEVAPSDLAPAQDALAHCLRQLSDRVGLLVRRHYYEGLPLGQLAQVLDMSLSAVKVALFRARIQLKDCVRQRLRAESSR
jgi:RNA polymerase sigma-70 factor (ECF subfamily)